MTWLVHARMKHGGRETERGRRRGLSERVEYLVKMQTSLFFVEVEREARVVVRVVVVASLSKKVQRAFPLGKKHTKLLEDRVR